MTRDTARVTAPVLVTQQQPGFAVLTDGFLRFQNIFIFGEFQKLNAVLELLVLESIWTVSNVSKMSS